jgi:alpha-ketoglutarate-dependent taurine dioxygenase
LDLVPQLSPGQVEFLLDALATHRIVCIAGQDLERFGINRFERFANHWGAVLPHPNNFTRGGVGAQGQGATDGEIEWIPFEQRTVSRANQTFPGELQCLPHESPAVLVTSNFSGPRNGVAADKVTSRVGSGGSWHTDIEYEVEPIYVSMFLVHKAPVSRRAKGGTWVTAPV